MTENQNIEWKESWRDEYIKWICGFANANGGVLVIGKNDNGIVTGLINAKKLLEDIPNKVRDILGIIIDVNIKTENNKEFLEIIVEKHPYPVSYKGQYHYRSGSTKQELKGSALDKFLLKKYGKHWDSIPVPNVDSNNLATAAFEYFRKLALKSGRLSDDILTEKNEALIEKLHLSENNYLKNAAILLFHPDPEAFITGAYIKIGFFKTNSDLLFQNMIQGDLFSQLEKTMDILFSKYLQASIRYDGLYRVEKFPYAPGAIRETLINAIVHKDYSIGAPIQISVYDDKIIFWNPGQLPENWTVENLKVKHPSIPYNPTIANTFFFAGLIEAWGRGFDKIINECNSIGESAPKINYDFSGLMVEFTSINSPISPNGSPNSSPISPNSSPISPNSSPISPNSSPISPNSSPNGSPISPNGSPISPKSSPILSNGSPNSSPISPSSERQIMDLIIQNPKITTPQIGAIMSLSKRTVLKYIKKLQQAKTLKRIGSARNGYWVLN